MTTRQRKILVFTFVLGSVLAAAVEIATACPQSGGRGRSGGGLYSQSRSGGNQQYAKGRRHVTPPPAPSAQMITSEYQLASSKVPVNKLPVAAAEPAAVDFENPFEVSDRGSAATEAKARQLRQQAALEHEWRAEQAAARDNAAADSTVQAAPSVLGATLED